MAISDPQKTIVPSQQHYAVQRAHEQIFVSATSGPLPQPQPERARVRMVAASICRVDDWQTPDGEPAIVAVLRGQADLRQHGKLITLHE